MAEKDIKKLGRAELLELLIVQTEETEKIQSRLADAEKQLADRRLVLDNCGSIAEASLQLSGIFDSAQRAADEYLRNVKIYSETREEIFRRYEAEASALAERMISEAEKKCQFLEEETKKKCEEMTRIARREAENYWDAVSAKLSQRQETAHLQDDEDEE